MSPDRWQAVSDLFDRAADLSPGSRSAFLDAEASGDPALREEVERLLALDHGASGILDEAPLQGASPAPPPEAGPWRLVERVGQGGMGEVWRAERFGSFEQTAAVKLVRPGHGESIAARFRAERQTLARLEHPAIARLLDGGTASDGRPYLAMEFVRGEPITAYADRQRLGVNERLVLFLDVCDAVAYAHSRLVVHRDLKPSNVLVASGEAGSEFATSLAKGEPPHSSQSRISHSSGGAHVKLLDFGIAKLLDASGDDLTRTGRPLLTPAYAAPEQRAGGAITTATDVYGLGVLLYELLVGRRPGAGDLTRPSEAVTTSATTGGRVPPEPRPASSGAAAPEASGALRASTPERLRKRLRGDLDRICLKALRADSERRYHGAAELGADIGRHLAGLPIDARPESVGYRVSKFVRRNPGLVAASLVAILALTVGLGVAVWQGGVARRALAVAKADAADAEAASQFMSGMLSEGNARSDDPRETAAAQIVLRSAARRLQSKTDLTPQVRASLLRDIGYVFAKSGMPHEAQPLLQEAIEASLAAGDIEGTGRPTFILADSFRGSGENERALDLYRKTVRLVDEYPTNKGAALRSWALLYLALGEPPNSEAQESLLREALTPPPYADVTNPRGWPYEADRIRQSFAQHAAGSVDTSRTLPLLREARATTLQHGWKPLAAFVLFTEALVRAHETPEAALPLFQQARRETAATLGRDHARYAWMMHAHARALLRAGRAREAEPLAEEAVASDQRLFGDGPTTYFASSLRVRADVRRALGHPGALEDYQRVIAMWDVLGPAHPERAAADSLMRTL